MFSNHVICQIGVIAAKKCWDVVMGVRSRRGSRRAVHLLWQEGDRKQKGVCVASGLVLTRWEEDSKQNDANEATN